MGERPSHEKLLSNNMFKRELKSFGYAFNGIKIASKTERHLRFHYLAAIVAIILSCVLNISFVEWALVILCIGFVIVAELFNTAIERLVDLSEPGVTPAAGVIKDVSAGAVLVASLMSLLVGGLVFIPKCI